MSFWSFKKQRTPQELVKVCRDCTQKLAADQDVRKAQEELSRALQAIKAILQGEENVAKTEQVVQLAQAAFASNLFLDFSLYLPKMEFESRKCVTVFFTGLLRRTVFSRNPMVEYLLKQPAILENLVKGYEHHDVALIYGQMLRECIRSEQLARALIYSPQFWAFFRYVDADVFDVASDAFQTFKDLLTTHKQLFCEFIDQNYERFFEHYMELLHSDNYVTRRQSLKLLSELLLDRTNYSAMTRFVSSSENLKTIMNLLRDKSRNIQYESFHVFKIFVANPKKTPTVENILIKNKAKLISFLSTFQDDRSDDDRFHDERAFLISEVEALP